MRPLLIGASFEQREEWLDDATCMGLTLLAEGVTGHDLYEGVASHMAATVRAKQTVSLELVADSLQESPSAEDIFFANGHVEGDLSLHETLADELTARQWDMVSTYVACGGSSTEAGALVGAPRSNVARAVAKARKILEGGGTSGEERTTIR